MLEPLSEAAVELSVMISDGPASDIFRANEARGLVQAISDNVEAVNESTFSPVFIALQTYAIELFVLAVTRLFQKPSRQFQLRSLPAIIAYVLDHKEELPIREPVAFRTAIQRLCPTMFETIGQRFNDVVVTEIAMETLQSSMPTAETNPALNALKELRDKRLAHPEHVAAERLPRTTWGPAESLLDTAGLMVAALGAYTSTIYLDADARYISSSDAQRADMATRRLLRAIGIGKPASYEPHQE